MHQRGSDWIGGWLACASSCCCSSCRASRGPRDEGEHGSGGLISLDKSLIVQVLNFVILLFILQRLLYKPFLAKMQERTPAIKKSLDEAQAARAEAARQQEENEARLRAAHAEAAAIRAQALKEAAEEQRKLVEAAQAESRARRGPRRRRSTPTCAARATSCAARSADLAIAVAEKLVRSSCARMTIAASSPTRSPSRRRPTVKTSPAVAKSYAKALFELARERNQVDAIEPRARARSRAWCTSDRELRAFFARPWVTPGGQARRRRGDRPRGSSCRKLAQGLPRRCRRPGPRRSPRRDRRPPIARCSTPSQGRVRARVRTAVPLTDARADGAAAPAESRARRQAGRDRRSRRRACSAASSPRSAA